MIYIKQKAPFDQWYVEKDGMIVAFGYATSQGAEGYARTNYPGHRYRVVEEPDERFDLADMGPTIDRKWEEWLDSYIGFGMKVKEVMTPTETRVAEQAFKTAFRNGAMIASRAAFQQMKEAVDMAKTSIPSQPTTQSPWNTYREVAQLRVQARTDLLNEVKAVLHKHPMSMTLMDLRRAYDHYNSFLEDGNE